MSAELLILFGPVVDAASTEEITTPGALLGIAYNTGADRAVEHVTCKVWKEILVETEFSHFVDFKQEQSDIIIKTIAQFLYKRTRI